MLNRIRAWLISLIREAVRAELNVDSGPMRPLIEPVVEKREVFSRGNPPAKASKHTGDASFESMQAAALTELQEEEHVRWSERSGICGSSSDAG